MAALTLVATAFGVVFAVQQIWPSSDEPQPVKNNYAFVVDRSATMGDLFDGKTKLERAVEEILRTVETVDGRTTARGLWFFGGGCGVVDENVGLRPDNASMVVAALGDLPATHGERPLVHALDAAVSGLADIPVTLGQGDVKTIRRIVVFTDGPDGCDDDLSRVTASLDASEIGVEFVFVGIDLTTIERVRLEQTAQSLPGIGGEPAEVRNVRNADEMTEVVETVISEDVEADDDVVDVGEDGTDPDGADDDTDPDGDGDGETDTTEGQVTDDE